MQSPCPARLVHPSSTDEKRWADGALPPRNESDFSHMQHSKNLLFVTASTSACAGEAKLVEDCLKNMGVGFRTVEWLSLNDFATLMSDGQKYDYIYLGAHADSYGFGEKAGLSLHPWEELGNAICATDCILPGGTLLLGCCRGGIKTVALKILKSCEKIDYICGPQWKVAGNDLCNGFHTFLDSRIRKNEEPAEAARKASSACGFTFICHDREDLQVEVETLRQLANIEWELQQMRNVQKELIGTIKHTFTGECPPA
jgi:hypothetical protein